MAARFAIIHPSSLQHATPQAAPLRRGTCNVTEPRLEKFERSGILRDIVVRGDNLRRAFS
jgi:hypothetical protein